MNLPLMFDPIFVPHVCSPQYGDPIVDGQKTNNNNNNPLFDRLPIELSAQILQHVDAQTLLRSCAITCRSWNILLNQTEFWRGVCLTANRRLPADVFERMDVKTIAKIAHSLNRNLVKNPSGQMGYNHWEIKEHDEEYHDPRRNPTESFRIDYYPQGAFIPSYFASMNRKSVKQQIIDLFDLGLTPDLMALGPKIVVSEYHINASHNISYKLTATLCRSYGRIFETVRYGSRGVLVYTSGHRYRAHFEETESKSSTPNDEAVLSGAWKITRLVFPTAPVNTRYVVITSGGGNEMNHETGYYGTKMTQASVVVSF